MKVNNEWVTHEGVPEEDGRYIAKCEDFDEEFECYVENGKAFVDGKQRIFMNYDWQKLANQS